MLNSVETGLQWKLHSLTLMLLRVSVIFARQLTISDSTPRKALCMSGYTVSGHPMYVLLCWLLGKSHVSPSHLSCHAEHFPLCYKTWNYLTILLELSQLFRVPNPLEMPHLCRLPNLGQLLRLNRIRAAISMYLGCRSICPS